MSWNFVRGPTLRRETSHRSGRRIAETAARCAGHVLNLQASIRFLEKSHSFLHVEALFKESFRVPLAPLGSEVVAAVYMDGAGKSAYRIDDRVDDVGAEWFGIPSRERLGAGGFDLSALAW